MSDVFSADGGLRLSHLCRQSKDMVITALVCSAQNCSTFPFVLAASTAAHFMPQVMRKRGETAALWEQLFTDITQFEDYRHFKTETGRKGPDFKHKASGQGLW